MLRTIFTTYASKIRFWFNDVFQSKHQCRFRKADVINFKINPKCTRCGEPLVKEGKHE